MKEYEELFANYNKLGIDEKRDEINAEIIKLAYIIKNYLNKFNHDIIDEPYDYQKGIDKNLSEAEFLNLNYRNIYYIKTELMLLMSLIENGVGNGN